MQKDYPFLFENKALSSEKEIELILDPQHISEIEKQTEERLINKGLPRSYASVGIAAIKKNNMKGKNRDQDKWFSSLRSPYERVFSKRNKRVRYKGVAKNQFAAFMETICFYIKRLSVLDIPGLSLS